MPVAEISLWVVSILANVHEVDGPDGTAWVVRRRWTGRRSHETVLGRARRRIHDTLARERDIAEHLDPGCLPDVAESLETVVIAVAVVLLLVFVVIPLLAVVIDLAVLAVAAVIAATLRTLLRRPWTIEARRGDGAGVPLVWRVKGWRASGRFSHDVAGALARGQTIEAPRS